MISLLSLIGKASRAEHTCLKKIWTVLFLHCLLSEAPLVFPVSMVRPSTSAEILITSIMMNQKVHIDVLDYNSLTFPQELVLCILMYSELQEISYSINYFYIFSLNHIRIISV